MTAQGGNAELAQAQLEIERLRSFMHNRTCGGERTELEIYEAIDRWPEPSTMLRGELEAEIERLKGELAGARYVAEQFRNVLIEIESYEVDWAQGVDENCNAIKEIAMRGLA